MKMLRAIPRLFVIKTKFEAYLIIYALALGAVERGKGYLDQYPGWGGWMLFGACTVAVLMAGTRIIDAIDAENRLPKG